MNYFHDACIHDLMDFAFSVTEGLMTQSHAKSRGCDASHFDARRAHRVCPTCGGFVQQKIQG